MIFGEEDRALQLPPRMSVEDQLLRLQPCGVRLDGGVSLEAIIAQYTRDALESPPFHRLLFALGDEYGDAPARRASRSLWHLDTECIYEDEDYAHVIRTLFELVSLESEIQTVRPNWDTRTIEMCVGDRRYDWPLAVRGKWVDLTVLGRAAAIPIERGSGRWIIAYHPPRSQDILLGAATPDQLRLLRETTQKDFDWFVTGREDWSRA